MRWNRSLRYRARQNEKGAAAIEFAMLAPVYFILLIGIMETALVMFAQNVLESAASNAARIGKTGYVSPQQLTREATVAQTVQRLAGFIMRPADITITTTAYNSLSLVGTGESYIDANTNGRWDVGENFTDSNGNGQYDRDIGRNGLGDEGNIVIYTISYPWPIMTPAMTLFLGTDGILTLRARVVVKNEPYG
jgi:Flp pilus assembly pilin Flp